MGLISDIFGLAYFTGHGVEKYLRESIDYYYKKYGVYEGNNNTYPTFKEILEYLQN